MKAIIRQILRNFSPAPKQFRGFEGNYNWAEASEIGNRDTDWNEFLKYSRLRINNVLSTPNTHLDSRMARASLAILTAFEKHDRARPAQILDFGGALGNLFFQLAPKLPLENFTWTVVETKDMVKIGGSEFKNPNLAFTTIEGLAQNANFDLCIASSSLQYLENPYKILEWLSTKSSWLLLDRLPLIDDHNDRLTIQNVEFQFYKGRHPWWFFSKNRFYDFLKKTKLSTVLEWDVPEDIVRLDSNLICPKGILLKGPTNSL